MTVQAWIIMSQAERDAAVALNDTTAKVLPRAIDNPLANNLGEGVLVSKYVAPARLLNDPLYVRWVDTLGTLPIRTMDSDALFVPDEN